MSERVQREETRGCASRAGGWMGLGQAIFLAEMCWMVDPAAYRGIMLSRRSTAQRSKILSSGSCSAMVTMSLCTEVMELEKYLQVGLGRGPAGAGISIF